MIAQIEVCATLRGLDVWFEVEILDRGTPRSYNDPGAGPGYSVGRVFEDIDAKSPELRQIEDVTDEEHQHLDALAAEPVLAWAEGGDPL